MAPPWGDFLCADRFARSRHTPLTDEAGLANRQGRGGGVHTVERCEWGAANAASPKGRCTAGKAAGQIRFLRRFLPASIDKNLRKFNRLPAWPFTIAGCGVLSWERKLILMKVPDRLGAVNLIGEAHPSNLYGPGPRQATEPIEIAGIGKMEAYADDNEQGTPQWIAPGDEQKDLACHGKDRAQNEDR
jgi:hypothetical protein